MIACVQQPVGVDELRLEMGVSIGIARFPRDGRRPHSLLRTPTWRCTRRRRLHGGCRCTQLPTDRHSVRKLSVLSEFAPRPRHGRDRGPLPADRAHGDRTSAAQRR